MTAIVNDYTPTLRMPCQMHPVPVRKSLLDQLILIFKGTDCQQIVQVQPVQDIGTDDRRKKPLAQSQYKIFLGIKI